MRKKRFNKQKSQKCYKNKAQPKKANYVSLHCFPFKVGAAWLFSLLAGPFCERFGRKPTILLASVVFTAGSVVMGVALSKEVRSMIHTILYNFNL